MKNKIISKKEIITIIIAAIAIVIINNMKFDWYIKSVVLPAATMLISYYYILKEYQNSTKRAHYIIIPIFLILISDFIIKIDFSNKLLNIIIIPILLTFYFFLLINKNFHIKDNCLKWIFKIFPHNLFKNLSYLKIGSSNIKTQKIKNTIIGSLIGGGIGFIIILLLTSADAYFKSFIKVIANNINLNYNNLTIFIISFIILFSTIINIIKNKDTEMTKIKKINVEKTTITTILYIVNFVFILFLIAEISKLTTNFLQLPKEYTYSSYAREGFFQLLFVTIINFSIISFIEYKTIIKNNDKIVKKLIYLLIAFSIILIFNSYYRMFLYIGVYGLTVLRTQVILFLAMELTQFIILIKKNYTGLKKDTYIFFIIVITTYIINIYICNDTIINLIMNLIN